MPYAIAKSAYVEKLEDLIDSDFEVMSVPAKIDKTAKHLNCYMNIERKVKTAGGRIQYGWAIMENALMCEAQHHAVWENKMGALIDIAPPNQTVSSILFIPDDRFIYEGRSIDNIRMNITGNAVVDHVIAVAVIINVILENGYRMSDDRVELGSKESTLYNKYHVLGRNLTLFAMEGYEVESKCYCNSGKAYNSCHGLGLLEMVKTDGLQLVKKPIYPYTTPFADIPSDITELR